MTRTTPSVPAGFKLLRHAVSALALLGSALTTASCRGTEPTPPVAIASVPPSHEALRKEGRSVSYGDQAGNKYTVNVDSLIYLRGSRVIRLADPAEAKRLARAFALLAAVDRQLLLLKAHPSFPLLSQKDAPTVKIRWRRKNAVAPASQHLVPRSVLQVPAVATPSLGPRVGKGVTSGVARDGMSAYSTADDGCIGLQLEMNSLTQELYFYRNELQSALIGSVSAEGPSVWDWVLIASLEGLIRLTETKLNVMAVLYRDNNCFYAPPIPLLRDTYWGIGDSWWEYDENVDSWVHCIMEDWVVEKSWDDGVTWTFAYDYMIMKCEFDESGPAEM